MDVALSISEGLARNVLAAKVDKEVWDANRTAIDVALKIKIEGKDEMKKRGVKSPNLADAWNNTFADTKLATSDWAEPLKTNTKYIV